MAEKSYQVTAQDRETAKALAATIQTEDARVSGVSAGGPVSGRLMDAILELLRNNISWTQLLSRILEIYQIIRTAQSFEEAIVAILKLFSKVPLPPEPTPGPTLP